MGSGKRSVALNLKSESGKEIFRKLCKDSDVLIEPFRPGVMEKMGLGPEVLLHDNPKLIYARLTGYGQSGNLHYKAGHDINYVAISGILSLLGRKDSNPIPPINIAADFAGGGLMCAMGIVMALYERQNSNKGQVVDASMSEGTAYTSSWLYRSQSLPIWGNPRGENILDSGAHFYETYKTKDNKYMAVGAIEPQFYAELLKALELPDEDQFADFEKRKVQFGEIFMKRTQKEWCEIFDKHDACVTPILSLSEAPNYRHNSERQSFIRSYEDQMVPAPSPRLSRTPATSQAPQRPPHHGEHTEETLVTLNYSPKQIELFKENGSIFAHPKSNL